VAPFETTAASFDSGLIETQSTSKASGEFVARATADPM